jgi:hypothetical protein
MKFVSRLSPLWLTPIVVVVLATLASAQTLPAPNVAATQRDEDSPRLPGGPDKRVVYEAVVAHRGAPIGTSIMLEITNGQVGGWIQRNDFFPIDSGTADDDRIRFTSSGNEYEINLKTGRINYSGPDGKGNQRVERMAYVYGMIYRLAEPARGSAEVTIRNEQGDRVYFIGSPAVWKREGPPIDRLGFDRYKELVGKSMGFFLARVGGTRYLAVLEEPEGMDLQKRAPREDRRKRGR